MKKIMKLAVPFLLVTTILTGCLEQSSIEQQQEMKVENANRLMEQTQVPTITKSLERENIRQRILVSNDPNTLQWIYPMSAGRVIGRFPVKGKVTSGGKRLTATEGYDINTSSSEELPDEQGTYGSSGEYIFWFNPAGHIQQHKGDYFVSTVPYQIDEGYGTISSEIDEKEEGKRVEYTKQMEEANKKMEELSKANAELQTEQAKQAKEEEE